MYHNFHGRRRLLSECESINGNKLRFTIHHLETPNVCSEFTLHNMSCPTLKKKMCIVLCLLLCLGVSYICKLRRVLLIPVFLLTCHQILKIVMSVKSESLLVIAPVGLQHTSTFLSGYRTSQFLPWCSVTDVIINEAISLQRVIYYLVVIVELKSDIGVTKKLIPLFRHTKPRLMCLEEIYSNVQKLLRVKANGFS